MSEETKDEQVIQVQDSVAVPMPIEVVSTDNKMGKDTPKKPHIFRSVQYGQHAFWITYNGQTGVFCSKKAEGIHTLKEMYPGEYIVEDVMPYTPRKYNNDRPIENSKK